MQLCFLCTFSLGTACVLPHPCTVSYCKPPSVLWPHLRRLWELLAHASKVGDEARRGREADKPETFQLRVLCLCPSSLPALSSSDALVSVKHTRSSYQQL